MPLLALPQSIHANAQDSCRLMVALAEASELPAGCMLFCMFHVGPRASASTSTNMPSLLIQFLTFVMLLVLLVRIWYAKHLGSSMLTAITHLSCTCMPVCSRFWSGEQSPCKPPAGARGSSATIRPTIASVATFYLALQTAACKQGDKNFCMCV